MSDDEPDGRVIEYVDQAGNGHRGVMEYDDERTSEDGGFGLTGPLWRVRHDDDRVLAMEGLSERWRFV